MSLKELQRIQLRHSDLAKEIVRSTRMRTRTIVTCTVDAYRSVDKTVDVTVGTIPWISDGADGRRAGPALIAAHCPIGYLGTKSSGYVAPAVAVGDRGLLLVCDRDIGRFLKTGRPETPQARRTHSLTDGVFIPLVIVDSERAAVQDTPAAVTIDATNIKLGATATEQAVLGNALIAAMDSVFSATVPPPLTEAAAAIAALNTAWQLVKASILAGKTKVS